MNDECGMMNWMNPSLRTLGSGTLLFDLPTGLSFLRAAEEPAFGANISLSIEIFDADAVTEAAGRGVRVRLLADAKFAQNYGQVPALVGALPGAEVRIGDAGTNTWNTATVDAAYGPVGDLAYRVNLMSAFFATLAAVAVCLIVSLLVGDWIVAMSAGLSFAFSQTLWSQAVVAEVYTLNAFLVGAVLLVANAVSVISGGEWLLPQSSH